MQLSLAFNGTRWDIGSVDLIFDIPTEDGFCIAGIAATTSTLESNTTWIIGDPFLVSVFQRTTLPFTPPNHMHQKNVYIRYSGKFVHGFVSSFQLII